MLFIRQKPSTRPLLSTGVKFINSLRFSAFNNYIFTCRTVAYHSNFKANLVFDKLNIFAAVFWQLIIFGYAGNIALPTGRAVNTGFAFSSRAVTGSPCYLAVNFVADANLDFIKIRKCVYNCKNRVGCTPEPRSRNGLQHSQTSPFCAVCRLWRRIRRRLRRGREAVSPLHRIFRLQTLLHPQPRNKP